MADRDNAHQEAERRLSQIATLAKMWQERTKQSPPAVKEGSALAGDDRLTVARPSSLAWYLIAVATEHLDFATSAMAATSTLYPTAYLTVLRTALLASTQAVRMLGPAKRIDRQAHAMRLTLEDLSNQLASTNEMTLSDSHLHGLQIEQANRLKQEITDLEPHARALGITDNDLRKVKANATEAIAWVAKFMHEQEILVNGTRLLWRTGSAVAHGARSHAISRLNQSDLIDGTHGTKYAKLHGDMEDITSAASASVLVLARAFELYDERRVNHRATTA